VQGHLIECSFVDQRADIIAREYPQIAPSDVAALAEHTFGLWGEGLRRAVEEFLQGGTLPSHEYQAGQCPVDPVQGYYIEQLFQPFELKRRIEAAGFRVSLRAYLGGARAARWPSPTNGSHNPPSRHSRCVWRAHSACWPLNAIRRLEDNHHAGGDAHLLPRGSGPCVGGVRMVSVNLAEALRRYADLDLHVIHCHSDIIAANPETPTVL
jgi:hypothetical protein